MIRFTCLILVSMLLIGCSSKEVHNKIFKISEEKLKDKIKGAWAAQTIGVTFGGPVEFNYNSTTIQDYQPIKWDEKSLIEAYTHQPGLYDDIYMDLTFVQVIEDHGVKAPAEYFANAFANADYKLWFANQTARYNILNGISPPESGHWLNNPCADDIDFQIEADFAGIMCPGMPQTASQICDKVGHIMNYGDGWYGGVYVAAMYSLAFISDNINYVVKEGLKTIPKESKFYKCINDVIQGYEDHPRNWKKTWFDIHSKWSEDIGSPRGVFEAFNIDAKINAAWVVMGLLYGEGDFTKTFEVSTRCGDDADCNPATAGGILATIKGYNQIPEFWRQGLKKVESIDFKYTTISLNKAYELSYKHALNMIKENGGSKEGNTISIQIQSPKTVPLEIAFENHFPVNKVKIEQEITDEFKLDFEGKGFAIWGEAKSLDKQDYVFETEMYLDGELIEEVKLPTNFKLRRFTPFWRYELNNGNHNLKLKLKNPCETAVLILHDCVIYSDKPYKANY